MICGPRIQSSPSWPPATSAPLTMSTIFTCVLGTMRPAEPGRSGAFRMGLRCVTGLASVMP